MTKKHNEKPSKRGKAKKKSLHCSSGTVAQKSHLKKWIMNMLVFTKLLGALVQLFNAIKPFGELVESLFDLLQSAL